MPNLGELRGLGAYMKPIEGPSQTTATAGNTGSDDVWVFGPVIDRLADVESGPFEGVAAIGQYEGTLNTGESVACDLKLQHSATNDAAAMVDYTDELGNGPTTYTKTIVDASDEKDVQLGYWSIVGCHRYIRIGSRVNLSRSGTDTCKHGAVGVLYGASRGIQS